MMPKSALSSAWPTLRRRILVAEIFRVVQKLRREGMTILLVEQNAHAALSIAAVGYVMETGRITLSGSGTDLLNNDEVQRAYLGM